MGQIEGYVFRITHTTHFYHTSTGALLLPFYYFLTTIMPTDDENQPKYDTPYKQHTGHTHTHTQTATTPRTTPARHPHGHEAPHSTHTHTKTKDKGTLGPHHPHQWTPARSGGEPCPRPSARS